MQNSDERYNHKALLIYLLYRFLLLRLNSDERHPILVQMPQRHPPSFPSQRNPRMHLQLLLLAQQRKQRYLLRLNLALERYLVDYKQDIFQEGFLSIYSGNDVILIFVRQNLENEKKIEQQRSGNTNFRHENLINRLLFL